MNIKEYKFGCEKTTTFFYLGSLIIAKIIVSKNYGLQYNIHDSVLDPIVQTVVDNFHLIIYAKPLDDCEEIFRIPFGSYNEAKRSLECFCPNISEKCEVYVKSENDVAIKVFDLDKIKKQFLHEKME